jgi:hypothetical protein
VALSTLPRIKADRIGVRFLQYADRTAIELPANGVADMADADLSALESQAVAAFDKIKNQDELSDEDVAEAERLAEIVTAVRVESGTRKEQVDGRRAALDSLSEKVGTPAEEDAEQVEAPAEEKEEEPAELIAASAGHTDGARRVRAAEVGGAQAKPAAPRQAPVSLTAAPDAPGRRVGDVFANVDEVADAVMRRAGDYPRQPMPGSRVRMQHGIAILRKDVADAGLIAASVKDDEVLSYAADQSRLPGGSLVAAGGWCAPSETLYDLAEIEAADGLVDLPEIQVKRGGIRFTPGPDFRAIYDGSGFKQTETQAIANTTKPAYNVPCPAFQEERADVIGLLITAGILQNSAYPELTARIIRGALSAHAHKVSAATIASMVGDSTTITPFTGMTGAATPVLNSIELAVEDIKYRHRMARNSVLETVFPAWIKAALRADLAYRQGSLDAMAVTDAQIEAWFTQRGIKAQFVYDWQDSALGQATAATTFPATVQFIVYPAGTFVRGHGEVISLDTIYDSAGLAQNQYVGLFTEESLLVAKLGHESRLYTVPLKYDGAFPGVQMTKTAA